MANDASEKQMSSAKLSNIALIIGVILAVLMSPWMPSNAKAQSGHKHDKRYHFTINVPEGWHPIRKELVDSLDKNLEGRLEEKEFKYIYGYSMSPSGDMTFPYVLFQVTKKPIRANSNSELEKAFNAKTLNEEVREGASGISDILKDIEVKTVLDVKNKRYVIPISAEVTGVGRVRGVSVGLLSREETVQINCYALSSEFEDTMPLFGKWADSFELDEGYEWEPGKRKGILIKAIVCGAVGGIVGVIVAFLNRRKKGQ